MVYIKPLNISTNAYLHPLQSSPPSIFSQSLAHNSTYSRYCTPDTFSLQNEAYSRCDFRFIWVCALLGSDLTQALTYHSLLASAAPGTTAAPAAYGGGKGGGGGGGGGSTCYPYTYFWTSSGYAEYPSTIYKTESAPFTKTLTSYKTIVTDVPSSYVTT